MTFSLHVDTARTWRGGQQRVLFTVLGLRAKRHRAALVAHPDGELYRRMSEGTDLIPLAPQSDIDLTAAWHLSRVIRQLTPDVVHAHDPYAVSMAATALSITSPSPRPVLVASRRSESHIAHNSFSTWKYGRVDCFIAASQAVGERLIADGVPQDKVTVVHDGVDVERIASLPAASVHAALYLPTHAPVVGTVGALVPHKGHHHLIDAAAIVVRSVPDVRFVIIGDGELRQALEEHIRRKHLERHVFLAGMREDALALLKGFDLFVSSATHESVCTALVDAMAASKASVTTAVGCVPEVTVDGDTGVLVPPNDHEAMAEAIIRLLEDDALRSRMGQAALDHARGHFAIEQLVDGTVDTYEALLAARAGATQPPAS